MLQSRARLFGWSWPFGVIATAALAVLIHLSAISLQTGESPFAALPTPHSMTAGHDWAAEFPVHIQHVTEALAQLAIPLPTPTVESQGAGAARWIHRIYELTLPAPAEPGAIQNMLDVLHDAAPGVTINVVQDATGAQAHVGVDGLLTHTLILHWLGRRPRVAIIIDDLGNDLRIARTLVGIQAPLTFSVMPFRPFSKEVAELAALFQREVLVHLPMEAENPEEFGTQRILHADAGRAEIVSSLDESLAGVPHAVGADNYMGSRLTSDRERMRWVLERLKEKGLFFVDARTTADSVGCDVAATVTVSCGRRDVFLDETDDEQAVRSQLQALLTTARTRGDAIAIGHPRPHTAAALQAGIADFAAAGVDIVPASTIVTSQSTPQR